VEPEIRELACTQGGGVRVGRGVSQHGGCNGHMAHWDSCDGGAYCCWSCNEERVE
jgi:hypothetical protein